MEFGFKFPNHCISEQTDQVDSYERDTEISLWRRRLILAEVANVRRLKQHFVVANVPISLQIKIQLHILIDILAA